MSAPYISIALHNKMPCRIVPLRLLDFRCLRVLHKDMHRLGEIDFSSFHSIASRRISGHSNTLQYGKSSLQNLGIVLLLLFFYIRYKHLNWYGRVRRMNEERLPQQIFGMVSTWKKKKSKSSKFLDAGSNNRNEREGD